MTEESEDGQTATGKSVVVAGAAGGSGVVVGVTEQSPTDDLFSYRAVIVVLGLVVVIVTVAYTIYALTPDGETQKLRELPDALISLGSAAVGALGGLLAPNPRKD